MSTQATVPALALVGPTGTGKSDTALRLAERLNGEIVSCDSVQVYRRFDIGSAKPSPSERSRIPHHLVDVVDWHEPFDAAVFSRLARTAMADIRARGRLPVLCGGTGLYMRALRYGLIAAPPPDPRLREALGEAERTTPGSLYARLVSLDPAGAQRIDAGNMPRVMRALELCLQTKQPASALQREHGFKIEQEPMLVCWLDRDTEILRNRLAARTEAMLTAGWVAEVSALLADGVSPEARPMRAVGYREVVQHLQGALPAADLAAKITAATWQYARRQRTWWRRERDVLKPDMAQIDALVSHLVTVWQGLADKA